MDNGTVYLNTLTGLMARTDCTACHRGFEEGSKYGFTYGNISVRCFVLSERVVGYQGSNNVDGNNRWCRCQC